MLVNKNGYYVVHLQCGSNAVVFYENDVPFSLSLDEVDDSSFKERMFIREEAIEMMEKITEKRFLYMCELAHRRAEIQKIQSVIQLQQSVEMGKQVGVVHDSEEPVEEAPVHKFQPKVVEKAEEKPECDDEPLPEPAENPCGIPAPAPVPVQVREKNGDYDGVVVEIPEPGMK